MIEDYSSIEACAAAIRLYHSHTCVFGVCTWYASQNRRLILVYLINKKALGFHSVRTTFVL